jgi:hypothetical protein
MRAQIAQAGDLCIDADEPIDQATCTLLRSRGVRGIIRYLSDLTTGEVATIIASGLILYFVNHSRLPGWIPSAAEGALDAQRDIVDLQKLSVPAGVHVFFDLEGVGGGDPAALIAHLDTYASAIAKAGYTPAVYVGAQSLLTSAQLYDLGFFLYWHGASHVEDITGAEAGPACGWAMYQGSIVDVKLFGITLDWDFVGGDFHGRLPIGVAA